MSLLLLNWSSFQWHSSLKFHSCCLQNRRLLQFVHRSLIIKYLNIWISQSKYHASIQWFGATWPIDLKDKSISSWVALKHYDCRIHPGRNWFIVAPNHWIEMAKKETSSRCQSFPKITFNTIYDTTFLKKIESPSHRPCLRLDMHMYTSLKFPEQLYNSCKVM